ncbi:hypothetical protein BD779DRAFT_1558127 [Infundibulicybe gibba]|nr:hypothetical protein BD779DRAFT_1558127 [Infundibulicybe gibba]
MNFNPGTFEIIVFEQAAKAIGTQGSKKKEDVWQVKTMRSIYRAVPGLRHDPKWAWSDEAGCTVRAADEYSWLVYLVQYPGAGHFKSKGWPLLHKVENIMLGITTVRDTAVSPVSASVSECEGPVEASVDGADGAGGMEEVGDVEGAGGMERAGGVEREDGMEQEGNMEGAGGAETTDGVEGTDGADEGANSEDEHENSASRASTPPPSDDGPLEDHRDRTLRWVLDAVY